MVRVRGAAAAIICPDCQVVGYCSDACRDSAKPLHKMECRGLVELEKLRGDTTVLHVATVDDRTRYWPPPLALTVARALNKQTLIGGDLCTENWLEYLAWNDSHEQMKVYPHIYRYVRMLVPSDLNDCDIYRTFCAVSVNAAAVFNAPSGTSAMALFMEYSLLNHMCRPNCEWEMEDGSVCVYAARDIEAGAQLGISYLMDEYTLIVREIRRAILKKNFGFDCRCSVCLGEEVPGSPWWVADQQKRLLIAPWSSEMAKKVMYEGWEKLCMSRRTELTATQAIQILEHTQAVINRILDERNIIVILIARRLISKYIEVGEYAKAVKQYVSIIEKAIHVLINEYSTACYVCNILCEIAVCLLRLGRMEQSKEMEREMHQLFPRVLTTGTALNASDGNIVEIFQNL